MTTQQNLLLALDNKYQSYQFYKNASDLHGSPFNEIVNSEFQHINILSEHLQQLGISVPENLYKQTDTNSVLEEVLQNA